MNLIVNTVLATACVVAATLIAGLAQAEPLSDCTPIEFTPDGDLTEFLGLGDGQDYIDLSHPGGPTDGDILAGVTVTPGVLVIKDEAPAPGAGDRPTGFHDLPAQDSAGPIPGTQIPTGFNIGRMFVSYNSSLDKYFFGIDCTAPSVLDCVAGTDPVAFDTDGDGDADSASELTPFGDPPLEEVPRSFQDDFYFVTFDFDSDGTPDLEVGIVERAANSFTPIPPGALILREVPGVSTRFVQVLPVAFQANLTAAAVGTVPGSGDIEFELSNASTLPNNMDPSCMTIEALADTFNDVYVQGAEEEFGGFLAFPDPQTECPPCPCDADLDGDGHVNNADAFRMMQCLYDTLPPGEEPTCDIDCDGDIDRCDADILVCQWGNPNPACCDTVICGACCEGPGVACAEATQETCDVMDGTYQGDGTLCTQNGCCLSHADCDDGNECTDDACNDAGGCTYSHFPDGTPCTDDGNGCTPDVCESGVCAHAPDGSHLIGGAIFTDCDDPAPSALGGVSIAVEGDCGTFTTTTGEWGIWEIPDVPSGAYMVTPAKGPWDLCHVAEACPPDSCVPSSQITVDQEHVFENQNLKFFGTPGCALYDMNYDEYITIIGDLPPFANCVYLGECSCPGNGCLCPGDCNCDGFLSIIGDIPCFVDCVYFGNCEECSGRSDSPSEGDGFTIGGAVYEDEGEVLMSGLEGITINIFDDERRAIASTMTAGLMGLWQIGDLPEGTYAVVFSGGGGGMPKWREAINIEVNGENEAVNQSIQLLRTLDGSKRAPR